MVKEVVVSEQYPLQEKSLDDKHSNVIQEDDMEEDDDETNRLSTTSNSRDEVEEIKKIIREETKVVRNWRWVVIVAMLLVGGAVTTLTCIFLANEEEDEFEDSVRSSLSLVWCSLDSLILLTNRLTYAVVFSSINLQRRFWNRPPLVPPPFVPVARILPIKSPRQCDSRIPIGPW